jgi:hypothetical protein
MRPRRFHNFVAEFSPQKHEYKRLNLLNEATNLSGTLD